MDRFSSALDLELIDETADRFDAAWKDGPRPKIEHFLGREEGKQRSALIEELVKIDLEYRCQSGERPGIEEYVRQFPDLLDPDGSVPNGLVLYARKVLDEFDDSRLQRKVQLGTLKAENGQEEKALCPHCGNTLFLANGRAEAIACPGCGNSFRVERERPTKFRVSDLPRVLGKFQLLELVGEGSFGTVYKARDAELDRIVAIKLPRSGYFVSPEDKQRFLREAKSTAQLVHPSIVQVHEIGHEDDVPYIVSDFVAGQTLAQLLVMRRPPYREAADLTAQIADALQYAHERGIVHRDVKPSNIMLSSVVSSELSVAKIPEVCATDKGQPTTDFGHPKLMDFGLARRDDGSVAVTLDGKILGTPAYMAPEQASGDLRQIDGRSDVYSLGVILYQMLTGEHPFRGTTPMLLHQVLCDEPRPPRRLNDRIPRDLETICLKAMAKTPARRYAAATDLAADLRRFLKGEPIKARPVGTVERSWRWCQRNPVVAGLTATVAAVLLVGTGAVGYFAAQSEARRREVGLQKEQVSVQRENVQEMDRLRAVAEEQRAEADRQRGLVRSYLYFSRVNMAERAWHEGHIARMDALLLAEVPKEATQEDFRGFEWFYLWRLRHENQFTAGGHPEAVVSVAFSPNNEYVASCCGGNWKTGTVNVWRLHKGEPGLTLERRWRELAGFSALAFSPDGKVLAAAGDNTVWLWDLKSGQILCSLRGQVGKALSVAFSPDSRRLASASENATVKVWDVTLDQELLTLKGHTGKVAQVAFSPDGCRLVTASADKTIKVWDAATGVELLTAKGHTQPVFGVAYSSDGVRFASAAGDRTLRIWAASTGKEILVIHAGNEVGRVAFSPDGRRIAAVSDQRVRVWDANTGQPLFTLKGHTDEAVDVAFSPDGRWLASGSRDKTLKLWEAIPQLEARTIACPGQLLRSVVFSPDGHRFAAGSEDGAVRMWDAITFKELMILKRHADEVRCVAFSQDGQRVASASNDRTIKVWDVGTGAELLTIRGHKDRVVSVAFSPNGQLLASGSEDSTVKIWDAGSGREILTFRGHKSRASIAFSPNSEHLASASEDCTVKTWDARTGRELLTLRDDNNSGNSMSCVAWSPDGRSLAAGSRDGSIRIWDASSGHLRNTLSGHTGYVCSVAFSPNGHRMASSSYDQRVIIWDVTTGQDALTLIGHTRSVQSVAFSPNGQLLASASGDGTIKIWDARQLASSFVDVRETLGLVERVSTKP